ncbi:MAG: GH32 C-terminal domain-containing protein [Clostridiales bacterium]|nr:GH32 C-terminal domain-containing protein [Clostridiales bacterium]
MSSDRLKKAREYERVFGEEISWEERPLFHVTPTGGGLNDPNGFSLYKGEIHLFYQYHPYGTQWGPMHWGHLKSRDFIRWERLPAALAPEREYDRNGCFFGSAVELPDGRHPLMYTGVSGEKEGCARQTQCIALGDGLNYQSFSGNPVLTGENLPEGGSAEDFRDPKIWWDEEEKRFFAVAVNRTSDTSGAVLLFGSGDGMRWEYLATVDRCRNEYGKMWECPDMFELDGMELLLVSPMEMQAKGLEFHSGNEVIGLMGRYEKETYSFRREKVVPVDLGLDFYAPQTLLMPDGRRIMIAWMQSWESSRFCPEGAKWFGMLTIPRELRIIDGRLIQTPVRELEAYRIHPVIYREQKISGASESGKREGRIRFPGIEGRILDMTVRIRLEKGCRRFTVYFAEDARYYTALTYWPGENILHLDRTWSGLRYNIVNQRKLRVREKNGELKLRFILDRFSAEIFVNDGEQALSACLYTPGKARGISFEADGCAVIDIEKYEIRVS